MLTTKMSHYDDPKNIPYNYVDMKFRKIEKSGINPSYLYAKLSMQLSYKNGNLVKQALGTLLYMQNSSHRLKIYTIR